MELRKLAPRALTPLNTSPLRSMLEKSHPSMLTYSSWFCCVAKSEKAARVLAPFLSASMEHRSTSDLPYSSVDRTPWPLGVPARVASGVARVSASAAAAATAVPFTASTPSRPDAEAMVARCLDVAPERARDDDLASARTTLGRGPPSAACDVVSISRARLFASKTSKDFDGVVARDGRLAE